MERRLPVSSDEESEESGFITTEVVMFAHVRPDDRRQVQLVSTLSSAWEDLRTGLDEWGSRKAKAEDKSINLFDQG